LSRPRQRPPRSKPIFLRLPRELAEAIENIAEEVGLGRTTIIKLLLTKGLKETPTNEELPTECRLKAIDALIEELKKEEEKVRRTWKQLLRSSPKAYLLRNIDLSYYHGDPRKIERLSQLIKDPKLKDALEVLINRFDYITEQITELLITQRELIQKLHKNYRPIDDYIKEAQKKIGMVPKDGATT